MKYFSVGCLALVAFCLCASALQARMTVVLQQRDGLIATVRNGRQMVTGDNATYLLANDKVSAKATRLRGQSAHILYYEAGEENYCVDLRSVAEPAFDIPAQ
jgi:hypothetical protein